MKTVIIIPARLESKRLPSKMLIEKNGMPLVVHTYVNAMKTGLLVYIATDSDDIIDVANRFGCLVLKTGPADCGTSRAYQALKQLPEKPDRVIILQGDCPDVDPRTLRHMAACEQPAMTATYRWGDGRIEWLSETWLRVVPKDIKVGVTCYSVPLLYRFMEQPDDGSGLEYTRLLKTGVEFFVIDTRPCRSIDVEADAEAWLDELQ